MERRPRHARLTPPVSHSEAKAIPGFFFSFFSGKIYAWVDRGYLSNEGQNVDLQAHKVLVSNQQTILNDGL